MLALSSNPIPISLGGFGTFLIFCSIFLQVSLPAAHVQCEWSCQKKGVQHIHQSREQRPLSLQVPPQHVDSSLRIRVHPQPEEDDCPPPKFPSNWCEMDGERRGLQVCQNHSLPQEQRRRRKYIATTCKTFV